MLLTDPAAARSALGTARLMLIFTPTLAGENDPIDALRAALPHVDVVQIRVKDERHADGASPARALCEWTQRVLDLVAHTPESPLVLVNDRVDVAAAFAGRGVHGVHLGDRDTPPEDARALLGEDALIGLSTHSAADVAHAFDDLGTSVDYLGFGPVFPTATKGYARGVGPEAAWVAHEASPVPVFPIGGIAPSNADELGTVGRACVGAAILAASDPSSAAAAIRAALGG